MTDLGCKVTDCTYNEDCLCCRSNIRVGGSDAKESCYTCCASFEKAEGTKAMNSCCGGPSHKLEILCDAENCKYNKSRKCSAKHIDVKHSKDTVHGETECATFEMK